MEFHGENADNFLIMWLPEEIIYQIIEKLRPDFKNLRLVCKLFNRLTNSQIKYIKFDGSIVNFYPYWKLMNLFPMVANITLIDFRNENPLYSFMIADLFKYNAKHITFNHCDIIIPRNINVMDVVQSLTLLYVHVECTSVNKLSNMLSHMPKLKKLVIRRLSTDTCGSRCNSIILAKLFYGIRQSIMSNITEIYLYNICCPPNRNCDYLYINLSKCTSLVRLTISGNLNIIKKIKNPNIFINMYRALKKLKYLEYQIFYRKEYDNEALKHMRYITDILDSEYIQYLNISVGNRCIDYWFLVRNLTYIRCNNPRSKLKEITISSQQYNGNKNDIISIGEHKNIIVNVIGT